MALATPAAAKRDENSAPVLAKPAMVGLKIVSLVIDYGWGSLTRLWLKQNEVINSYFKGHVTSFTNHYSLNSRISQAIPSPIIQTSNASPASNALSTASKTTSPLTTHNLTTSLSDKIMGRAPTLDDFEKDRLSEEARLQSILDELDDRFEYI